jgi:hypothetical protein
VEALGEAYILKSLPPARAPPEDYDPPWGPWERHTFSKVLYVETLQVLLHGQDAGDYFYMGKMLGTTFYMGKMLGKGL